jgi:hypothetical protein
MSEFLCGFVRMTPTQLDKVSKVLSGSGSCACGRHLYSFDQKALLIEPKEGIDCFKVVAFCPACREKILETISGLRATTPTPEQGGNP